MINDEKVNELYNTLSKALDEYWENYYKYIMGSRKSIRCENKIRDVLSDIVEHYVFTKAGSAVDADVLLGYNEFEFEMPRPTSIYIAPVFCEPTTDMPRANIKNHYLHITDGKVISDDIDAVKDWVVLIEEAWKLVTWIVHDLWTIKTTKLRKGGKYYLSPRIKNLVEKIISNYNSHICYGIKDAAAAGYAYDDIMLEDVMEDVVFQVAQDHSMINTEFYLDVHSPLLYTFECDISDIPNMDIVQLKIIQGGKTSIVRYVWTGDELYYTIEKDGIKISNEFFETMVRALKENALLFKRFMIKGL